MRYTIHIASEQTQKAYLRFFRCLPEPSACSQADASYLLTESGSSFVICDEGGEGAYQSYIEVRTEDGKGFTFKPRDVFCGETIFSSCLKIAITGDRPPHDYQSIKRRVAARKFETQVCREEQSEEATLRQAERLCGRKCPTFLTVPGNARLFEVGFRGFPIEEKQHMELYDYIIPRINWDRCDFGEGAERVVYRYLLGRGMGCRTRLRRSLYRKILPILKAELADGGVVYSAEYFVDTLHENIDENKGTHYLEADFHSAAHVLTHEQEAERRCIAKESEEEMPFLRMQITVKNVCDVAKYAFIRLPQINTPVMAESNTLPQKFENGRGIFCEKVYMMAFSDGCVAENQEVAYLLPPQGKKTVDILLFFVPVSAEMAEKAVADFQKRKVKAAKVWQKMLGSLKNWHLPEKKIDQAIKAGFLQLRASCFGEKDSDVIAPCIGVYSPIATESISVVEVLSSFGAADFAKKCVNYFYRKQHGDGFIQNMVNYMAETGGTLYLTGRIYRETRDKQWLEALRKNICAAVTYIERWIQRNQEERHGGKGMLDGQVADPKDPYRAYSLNALACAGLREAAELLHVLSDPLEKTARLLAENLQDSIKRAYSESEIRAVLVPLENGEWVPLLAPWAEDRSGCCLHLNGGSAVTHASAVLKDSLLSGGLVFVLGLLPATGKQADDFVYLQTDMFSDCLTDFSQPYYNVVPYLNLYRGERNSFLREYYTAFSTMSDRETYSFWEHYFLATPHKTSEQAAFLLRSRMMLYYERSDFLYFLSGVPRNWLLPGKRIYLENAVCAFGNFSLEIRSLQDSFSVEISCRWFTEQAVQAVWRFPGQAEVVTSLASGNHRFNFKRSQ